MAAEMVVQVGILILTLATFLIIHYHPKKTLAYRTDHKAAAQTRRHMSQATNLLARARSATHWEQLSLLAKTAMNEAEKVIALAPKDPAPHILKSQALDLMGHKSAALRSLDWALSAPRIKTLSGSERVEALVRRAELKLTVNRRRRVDSALSDLEAAIGFGASGSDGDIETKAFCLLGECYELKGMKEEARGAFEKALKIEPGSTLARLGLDRLGPLGS